MEPVRSALYLDFDNVFSSLSKLDPELAMLFAEKPELWIKRLAQGSRHDSPRRWLVLRSYMNPSGSIPHPRSDGSRLYFSSFRPRFTDAGFEVVDCPRLSHTKNGADIRLVVDAVDALRAEAHYDEFVIASGDSDMTPLLVRLRADDRRTTLLSPSDSAVVLGAVADHLIGGDELLELLDTRVDEIDAVLEQSEDGDFEVESDSSNPDIELTEEQARVKFRQLVVERYSTATEPLNLATLAHEVRRELGPVASSTRWFGHNGFARAIKSLELPSMKIVDQFLWDSTRHPNPSQSRVQLGADQVILQLPEPVERVTQALKLPKLPSSSWRRICDSLAEYAVANEFNLSESTRWSRDRLTEGGVRVNRAAVGLVVRGAAFGGSPLHGEPTPTSDEIAAAFVDNLVNRVAAADVDLLPTEIRRVRAWFGVSEDSGSVS